MATVKVANIPTDVFDNVKNTIYSKYDLEDEMYATKEYVFYETRRIVGKTPHMMTTEQKYSTLDAHTKKVEWDLKKQKVKNKFK